MTRQASSLSYLLGRDAEGRWVAVERHGRGGGIFATRAAALRYAIFETGHRAGAVAFAAGVLKLGF